MNGHTTVYHGTICSSGRATVYLLYFGDKKPRLDGHHCLKFCKHWVFRLILKILLTMCNGFKSRMSKPLRGGVILLKYGQFCCSSNKMFELHCVKTPWHAHSHFNLRCSYASHRRSISLCPGNKPSPRAMLAKIQGGYHVAFLGYVELPKC